MEIYQEEGFSPIHIVLKSQAEVDMLFSIVNFSPVTEVFDGFDVARALSQLHHTLNEYSTAEYEKYHILLDGHIRRA